MICLTMHHVIITPSSAVYPRSIDRVVAVVMSGGMCMITWPYKEVIEYIM